MEADEQEKRLNALVAEKEKKKHKRIRIIIQKLEKTQARIDALHAEHGSNLEIETEINRLNLLKKNYETEFEK